MQVDVLNIEGKKVKTVELSPAIFEAPINVDLMHQAFVRQMANARLGTSDTKTRNEVAGGGRKPWRQKVQGVLARVQFVLRSGKVVAASILPIHVHTLKQCQEKCVELLCVLHCL